MAVTTRCEKTAEDGQRCVYAAEHKGICSIYMPSDDRGWVFERLWSDQTQLQGAVADRERLLRRLEQLEASARAAESALAGVLRQIAAARDAAGGQS